MYIMKKSAKELFFERMERVNPDFKNPLNENLSEIPVNLDKVDSKTTDKEILRIGILAELDAINLYEQMAAKTKNSQIKKTLLDIAKEEKTHIGEFEALLLKFDKEQKTELENGKKEVEEKTEKK